MKKNIILLINLFIIIPLLLNYIKLSSAQDINGTKIGQLTITDEAQIQSDSSTGTLSNCTEQVRVGDLIQSILSEVTGTEGVTQNYEEGGTPPPPPPRRHEPLVLDLSWGNPIGQLPAESLTHCAYRIEFNDEYVPFDIEGTKAKINILWPTNNGPNGGHSVFLCCLSEYQENPNLTQEITRPVNSIYDLFGTYREPNGFCQLKGGSESTNDLNKDGRITAADPIFKHIFLWKDANHDGVFNEQTEKIGLEDAKISAFEVRYDPADKVLNYGFIPVPDSETSKDNLDNKGNTLMAVGTYIKSLPLKVTIFEKKNVPVTLEGDEYKINEPAQITSLDTVEIDDPCLLSHDSNCTYLTEQARIARVDPISYITEVEFKKEGNSNINGTFKGYLELDVYNPLVINYTVKEFVLNEDKTKGNFIDIPIQIKRIASNIEETTGDYSKVKVDISGTISGKIEQNKADLVLTTNKTGTIDLRYPAWDLGFKPKEYPVLKPDSRYVVSDQNILVTDDLLKDYDIIIEGSVIAVDTTKNTATINVGTNHSVRKGIVFDIFRTE